MMRLILRPYPLKSAKIDNKKGRSQPRPVVRIISHDSTGLTAKLFHIVRNAICFLGLIAAVSPFTAHAGPLPPQGVYEAIALTSNYKSRLDQISAAGFKVVLNYSTIAPYQPSITKDQLLAYANYANSKGLKIIWSMKEKQWRDGTNLVLLFRTLASQLQATNNTDFITKVVKLLKDHPATWGWYTADDDRGMIPSQVISVANIIKAADPNPQHKRLTVQNSEDWRSGYMQSFEPANDVIGLEHYPIGQFATQAEVFSNTQIRLNEVFGWAKTKNKPMVTVLQAHDVTSTYGYSKWWPYSHWPTAKEMTSLRNQVLATARAKGVSVPLILWYSYFDITRTKPSQWSVLVQGAFAPAPF